MGEELSSFLCSEVDRHADQGDGPPDRGPGGRFGQILDVNRCGCHRWMWFSSSGFDGRQKSIYLNVLF
ncbi:hypothetical protein pipiens_010000 [Culex pipiens pipiens]|uniref:Uncharacterized protein n=1 Tax=Culex pipiens pipiens TaxID=38569 RepID=A0ABD1DCV3_CULPP